MEKPKPLTIILRTRIIIYWVCGALIAFQLGTGSVADLLQPASTAGFISPLLFSNFLILSWVFRPRYRRSA